jgi:hypothetical protein
LGRKPHLQKAPAMQAVLIAALSYFVPVFAAAFLLGVLRISLLAPHVGDLGAVAIEVPVVLAISWVVAGWMLRRQRFGGGQRLLVGILAFVLLIVTELVLAILAFDQTLADFMGNLGTPPGILGLAGQIIFALIPAIRR